MNTHAPHGLISPDVQIREIFKVLERNLVKYGLLYFSLSMLSVVTHIHGKHSTLQVLSDVGKSIMETVGKLTLPHQGFHGLCISSLLGVPLVFLESLFLSSLRLLSSFPPSFLLCLLWIFHHCPPFPLLISCIFCCVPTFSFFTFSFYVSSANFSVLFFHSVCYLFQQSSSYPDFL